MVFLQRRKGSKQGLIKYFCKRKPPISGPLEPQLETAGAAVEIETKLNNVKVRDMKGNSSCKLFPILRFTCKL